MASFFKVVVLGDGGIGKTSICNYLTTGEFFGSYKLSIGADFFSKKLLVEGEEVSLQICDIGGQDQFAEISEIFTKGAHGAILCYDTTRRDTLDSLDKWLSKLEDPDIPKVLVSTKNDVEDLKEVWDEEGLAAADRLDIPYYIPTTSLKGIGITETFEAISRLMLKEKKGEPLPIEAEMVDVSGPERPEIHKITEKERITAQPMGLGRMEEEPELGYRPPVVPETASPQAPPTPKSPLIEPPAVEPPTAEEPPAVSEPPAFEPPTAETSATELKEAEPSFTEPITLSSSLPSSITKSEEMEDISSIETSDEEPIIEPPTEPEKTATQPISSITPPVTEDQPIERSEERIEPPSFSRESIDVQEQTEVGISQDLPELSEAEEAEEAEEAKPVPVQPERKEKSRFSFLDRLREERKRYEEQKEENDY
ncbi:MAG: GTP-binding protein [Candidatus Heimdallarchaeota archaeon]|nr:GTP-binding protein [Candidatus Heimdallarchaeota archaeon]